MLIFQLNLFPLLKSTTIIQSSPSDLPQRTKSQFQIESWSKENSVELLTAQERKKNEEWQTLYLMWSWWKKIDMNESEEKNANCVSFE